MLDIENNNYHIGLVKWFGGYNHHKDKENDFGFIQAMDGEDIFIHKNEIKTGDSLNEDELVIYEAGEKKGKVFAKNLHSISDEEELSIEVFQLYFKNREIYPDFFNSYAFNRSLIRILNDNLNDANIDFLNIVQQEADNDLHVYEIIKKTHHWSKIFSTITSNKVLKKLLSKGFSFDFIPPDYIEINESMLYKNIECLDKIKRDDYFKNHIDILPINIILVGVIKKILTNEEIISCRYTEIKNTIEKKFRGGSNNLPEYVSNAFNYSFQSKNDYLSNPIIWKIIEPILLKKYLYNKKTNVSNFFNHSSYLKNKIEYFILANLFTLIQANNSLDIVYKVFLHRLWESLSIEDIDINDKGLFNLFPSCSTMGRRSGQLSCEAVFWPKTEKYLCRGQVCNNAKVNPNVEKHYLDFNIYDWFQHYGINYINERAPSKKDFPIKLAGYFNRLKEIFNILHCRECNHLMKPDMRYARIEYIDFETGKPVTKSMAAAYRATVFECGTEACKEYENKYYINHCVGFGCDSIIDSRDLKIKCDNGLYICRGCGGCCEQDARYNSVGLCPDCGSQLELYEDERKADRYGNYERHVKCSNQHCNFTISENLPKKFYLPSCTPVKKINRKTSCFM